LKPGGGGHLELVESVSGIPTSEADRGSRAWDRFQRSCGPKCLYWYRLGLS